jgi:protein-L-isoaspartate(D-aspartate) O-methyltransferase
MERLISQLVSDGYLRTPAIINSFHKIKRSDFLPENAVGKESFNAPLPIGCGQTNSQPLTVAFMIELLKPKPGQKILDVGCGSGWTSAILADIVGPGGRVFGIERIPQLKDFGQKNAAKYCLENVEFFCQDGSRGLPDYAPFDRILVSAAAHEIPNALKDQLKFGGRLVIPTVAQDIRLIKKISSNKFSENVYPGFVFVPLIVE